MSRSKAGPEDTPLPMMPDAPAVTYNTADASRPRNALSRALTAEYLGLDVANYMDINREMVLEVEPPRLKNYLIDIPLDLTQSPCGVSYTDFKLGREINIAVTPSEATLIPRFLGAFQRSAAIRSGARVTSQLPTDSDLARSHRAAIHAQENKLPKLLQYSEMQGKKIELLDKYITASNGRLVGLSLFGSEGKMRENLAFLQTYVLDEMVLAYGTHRSMSQEQMKRMSRSIEFSIFLHPRKIENFHTMMRFLREYNGHKLALADQRIDSIRRNIGRGVVQHAQE